MKHTNNETTLIAKVQAIAEDAGAPISTNVANYILWEHTGYPSFCISDGPEKECLEQAATYIEAMKTRDKQTVSALVAANIKRLRIDQGHSQKELAIRMRFHHLAVQSWCDQKIGELEHTRKGRERNITVDDLVAVSHALSVELWELLPSATAKYGPQEGP